MTHPEPSITVKVDVTNPGQFFACCGLLELAHRMPSWSDVEGRFDLQKSCFVIEATSATDANMGLDAVLACLRDCDISGLDDSERHERDTLEDEKRLRKRLAKKSGKNLTEEEQKQRGKFEAEHVPLEELPSLKEQRRKELGEKARAGSIVLGPPFRMRLDWWQANNEGAGTPKTWAGLQELHKIARAAQDALVRVPQPNELYDYSCVMRMPSEYCKKDSDREKAVEPFYFDARRFAHALDTGFSLDIQDAETTAHPAVELLALIGLQRFRPSIVSKRSFRYELWTHCLPPSVAASVTCGAVASTTAYQFTLLARDDQNRYKAFDFGTSIGDQS